MTARRRHRRQVSSTAAVATVLVAAVAAGVLWLPGGRQRLARAFEFVGIRWPSGTVGYWVNPNFPNSEIAGDDARQVEILQSAARAWTDQTQADFVFRFEGTTSRSSVSVSDERNACFWADADGGEALAVTIVGPSRRGGFGFDMVFFGRTFDRANAWSSFGEPTVERLDLLGVATHEFGHALGLDHTDVMDATMNSVIFGLGLPLRTLAADDRAGAESLYGRDAAKPEPAVAIVAVQPPFGPAAGGNEVVIAGVNFTYRSESQLVIGGFVVDPSRWRVETPGRIRIFDMPPGVAGIVDVQLTNSLGFAGLDGSYSYQAERVFVRGDSTGEGILDVSDASFSLNHIFLGGPQPQPCIDATDADDDGTLTVSDAIYLLNFLFQGGPQPRRPFPEAGGDPTPDALDC